MTMTLDDLANIAQIILAGISAVIAWFAYRWLKLSTKVEACQKLSEASRHYNELVLKDRELQAFEASRHPYGSLTEAEVVMMYRYFLVLNLAVDLWEANLRGAVEPHTFRSFLWHCANKTHKDKEFIKTHVFPRGYPREYRKQLEVLWFEIDCNGLLDAA